MRETPRNIREEAAAVGAPTLIGYVYENLRRDIVSGIYAQGEKLRVEPIRAGYGVAASTMREALARLVSDGLVIALGQRGFRVAPMSRADLRDLTRLRILLESEAVVESMRRGDIAWEAGAVAAFHTLTRADERVSSGRPEDLTDWERHNQAFHHALAAACGSERLLALLETLYRQHERYRMWSLAAAAEATGGTPRDLHGEHEALLKAVLGRDAERARDLLAAHIRNTADALERRLTR